MYCICVYFFQLVVDVLVFIGFVYVEVFDCFGQDYCWLIVGVYCLLVGGVYFLWIVVIMCQGLDVVVVYVCDQFQQFGVMVEEMFVYVSIVL